MCVCERQKGRKKEERTSERKGELEEARGLKEYKHCVCVRARESWICVEKYTYVCLVLWRHVYDTIDNTSHDTSNQKERKQSNRMVLFVNFCRVCHYMCVCAIERESAHVRACVRASEQASERTCMRAHVCVCVCVCVCMCVYK